jgi:hypothetical protein
MPRPPYTYKHLKKQKRKTTRSLTTYTIHPQGFNLGAGPLLGLLFQALLLALRVDPRLATGLLIVSCLVSIRASYMR